MQIVDSDRDEILIGGNWLEKYQANLMLAEGKITFKANGRYVTVKIVKHKGKVTSKWIQFEEEAMEINGPPSYQPTIVIESDSEEEEEETPTINWTKEEESRMTIAELNERLDRWEAKIVELKEYLARKDPREEILEGQKKIL